MFFWCHVRHTNPIKLHPERIRQTDKELANDLDYDGIKFPVDREDFNKVEMKTNISVHVFCYKNKLPFSIYLSGQTFENSIDLLLVIDEIKSHYEYIKDFDRFMFHKIKNTFVKVVYSVLVVKIN